MYSGLLNILNMRRSDGDTTDNSNGESCSRFPTPMEMIERSGYQSESHEVTTEDGYLLTMHRILPRSPPAEPVILLHGMFSCSGDWLIDGPQRSLGFVLANAGYDVWLGNYRGNRWSRRHVSLDPDRDKQMFWDFSWHEMGEIDLPTMIDHVLMVTGASQVYLVAHSQGTTTCFVMMALKPDYRRKVRLVVCLAPIAFLSHVTNPVFRMMSCIDGHLDSALKLLGVHELLSDTEPRETVLSILCRELIYTKDFFRNIFSLIAGQGSLDVYQSSLQLFLRYRPTASSCKQMLHYLQQLKSGRFCQYDYGQGNMERYGSPDPPDYDLSMTTVPVALFYSDRDWLATPEDVLRLHSKLPQPVCLSKVEDEEFSHNDFMWGLKAKQLVYDAILEIISQR